MIFRNCLIFNELTYLLGFSVYKSLIFNELRVLILPLSRKTKNARFCPCCVFGYFVGNYSTPQKIAVLCAHTVKIAFCMIFRFLCNNSRRKKTRKKYAIIK